MIQTFSSFIWNTFGSPLHTILVTRFSFVSSIFLFFIGSSSKQKSNYIFLFLSFSSYILSILIFLNDFSHRNLPIPFPPLASFYVESDVLNELKFS